MSDMRFIDQTVNFPGRVEQPLHRATESGKGSQATSFLFVNSQKGQTPPRSRQLLRSHVMQQARSKRKWSTSRNAANSSNTNLRSSAAAQNLGEERLSKTLSLGSCLAAKQKEDFRAQRPIATSRKSAPATLTLTSPKPSISSDDNPHCPSQQLSRNDQLMTKDWYFLDPYANLPVKLDASTRGMLDQYLFSLNESFAFSGRWQPSISESWFVAAFDSRAFMYSLLCAAATHLYALGRVSYYAIMEQKSSTMTELARTLHDPVKGAADGNIGAVFNLMCVDEAFPMANDPQCPSGYPNGECQKQKLVHSNGLKQMVRVRGGLLNLRHNQCLFSFLLWHATAHSVASFQPSVFFSCPIELASLLEQFTQPPRKPVPPKRFARLLIRSTAPDQLVTTARHVTELAQQFGAWLAEDPEAPSYSDIHDFTGILIQSLLLFLNSPTEFDPMSEAIATAMVMFAVRMASDVTPHFDSLHCAATKWLWNGLAHASHLRWDSDIRLWVTTVGAICGQGSREEAELKDSFVRACKEWDVVTENQLLDALKSLLWIESRLDEGASRLWTQLKDRILTR